MPLANPPNNRYEFIEYQVRYLLGDLNCAEWDDEQIYCAIATALGRYSQVVERIETQVLQLEADGLFSQSLENWSGDQLCEVVYLHWPGASTIPTVPEENELTDWWYWFHGEEVAETPVETVYVDLKTLDSSDTPETNDYILVSGVCKHRIEGMDYQWWAVDVDNSEYTTIPLTHDHIIALGAAAYALRSREVSIAVEVALSGGGGSVPTYPSPYHVGILADLAERYMRDFESELYVLAQKKLHRPIWGDPERRRLQRLTDSGVPQPRPKSR